MKCIFPLVLFFILITSCNKKQELIRLEGYAQGTTFHISYLDDENRNFSKEIDSIFKAINSSLSIYDSTSIISRININSFSGVPDRCFLAVFNRALEISKSTEGAFDITIGPLVNKWGFGNKKEIQDSLPQDSLLKLVGYQQIFIQKDGGIKKKFSAMQLDVNGIAQGFTVDEIANLLERNSIKDYMVEVGGEVRTSGKNKDGNYWKIGIDKPIQSDEGTRVLQAISSMENFKSMATSGSYRKFYEKDGKKFSHTISPFTGKPVDHNLISVSVFADDCMSADAYATAFMVMGFEKSLEFINSHPELAAFFIVADDNGFKTHATGGILISGE